MKVCIFVDGENFRHAIVRLFPQFKQEDYLPYATWADLFDWLVKEVIAEGGMLEGLEEKPEKIAGELYGQLSENAHERVERTDSGRAIEEGTDIFEWPAPILRKSLLEFLDDFHLAMEIGVVAVLNQLSDRVPGDRLRDNSKRLLGDEVFKSAHLKYSTKLLKGWASEFPI